MLKTRALFQQLIDDLIKIVYGGSSAVEWLIIRLEFTVELMALWASFGFEKWREEFEWKWFPIVQSDTLRKSNNTINSSGMKLVLESGPLHSRY